MTPEQERMFAEAIRAQTYGRGYQQQALGVDVGASPSFAAQAAPPPQGPGAAAPTVSAQQPPGLPPGLVTGATQLAKAAAASEGGISGAAASAGPWAALAAVILANETQARDKGRRAGSDKQYAQDLFTGKVLQQDAEHLGDKIGGPLGQATKIVGRLGNPEGLAKTLEKGLKPWEWF